MSKGVLIFQVEYDAEFLVPNLGKQSITVHLGWFPLLVMEEKFQEEMILGPGRNLTGNILADMSSLTHPVIVSG